MTATPGQSLADVVHEQIRTLILDGTWPARSRLPSEADLATKFGVSRPVVRQALARLRDDGVVASRQGSGSFVQDLNPAQAQQVQFPALGSVADLERFLNFREGVEGEVAAAAAIHHGEHRVEELRRAVQARLSEVSSLASEADFAFHLAVAQASENPFYVNTLISLREQILFGMNLGRSFLLGNSENALTIARQHNLIVEAIVARDPDLARERMRAHLQWARARLLTGGAAS